MPPTSRRPARRRTGLLATATAVAVLIVIAGLVAAGPADAAPRHAAVRSFATPGTTTAAAPRGFGLVERYAPGDLTGLRAAAASVGRVPDTVTWYVAWSTRADFPVAAARAVAATGAAPVITWEPWDPSAGTTQPAYALAAIAAGRWDAYLTRWARGAASYRAPVVVRFAHEMNGSWYPWAEQVNGNHPGDYVRAWRHVHDVVVAAGAGNVRWSWSPNVDYPGATPLEALYPGDATVDQVAVDGYNRSTLLPGSRWTPFWDVVGPTVARVGALTRRPLVLGEVGCPEVGGDKAAWVTDMFARLAQHPEVRGLTWFDLDKETDWRMSSSRASLAAFRAGLASYR